MLIVPPPSPELTRGLSATLPLLLHGPRLPDGRIADVMVADGVIVSVGDDSAGRLPSHVMDLRGYLLLPSLVEPHAHLRLTAPVTRPGEAGARTAPDRDRWVAAPADLTPADVATRAWNGAARYLAAGTTAIRVHVDIGQESGLRAVEALLEVRAGLAGILDIQIVAAASAPLTGLTGATSRARLRHALAAGADLAGVGPGFGDETGRAVEALAIMAAGAGTGLDLHIGERSGVTPGSLARLTAIARAWFGYPLAVSHVASFGTKKREQRRTARSLADAGIGVVVVPRPAPGWPGAVVPGSSRGSAVVRGLLAAGVPIAAGGDGSLEPSGPADHADPLGTAAPGSYQAWLAGGPCRHPRP